MEAAITVHLALSHSEECKNIAYGFLEKFAVDEAAIKL